jgi:hypothetical protein
MDKFELEQVLEETNNEFNPYLGEILSEDSRSLDGKVGHC